LEFEYLETLINSESTYYEINDDFGLNDFYNNKGKHAGKGMNVTGRQIFFAIGQLAGDGDNLTPDPDDSSKNIALRLKRKKLLKNYIKDILPSGTKYKEKKKIINFFRKLVAD